MGISAPLTFTATSDASSTHRSTEVFHRSWPLYRTWLLTARREKPLPSAALCLSQLRKHMPELLPTFERLLKQFGAPAHLAQFLCLYNPPTIIAGCSQAVWKQHKEVALIRNYDFPQSKWDALQLHSNWNGTQVIAMTDCFWGVLDGINEHGLAVSLSFGGKLKVGNGFAITLVLRYILEFCSNVAQATEVLRRVPVAMAYNVALLDGAGNHEIVYVGPDQTSRCSGHLCATNHQQKNDPESNLEILIDSNARLQFLNARLADRQESLDHIQQLFLGPPLYRKALESRGWGTLYTASYYPLTGAVNLNWPGRCLQQSFTHFTECQLGLGPVDTQAWAN